MKQTFLPLITLILSLLLTGCGQHKNMPRNLTSTQKAYHMCASTHAEYEELLAIVENSTQTEPERLKTLHQYILLKNEALKKQGYTLFNAKYKDLPYLQLKTDLDRSLRYLHHYKAKLRMHKQPKGICNISQLIARLELLNNILIVLPEYHLEKVKAADPNNTFPLNILRTGIFGLIGKIISI